MKSLNGYWYRKNNPNIYVFIEKTFKKGYVTGFMYEKLEDGGERFIFPAFRCTHEELLNDYERK